MSIPKESVRVPETVAQNLDREASVPVARSPLAPAGAREVVDGWEYCDGPTAGPVLVSDRSALAKVHIRVDASPEVTTALGTRFGRAVWVGDRLVVGSGPDEWLVLAAPGLAKGVAEECTRALRAADPGRVSVVDVTHGRALMRVSGPETLSLLRRVTAVDLDDRLVPNGSALRTSVARVVTDVVRDDQDGSPSYLLHCERSSGLYLQRSLLAAGADLGALAGASRPAWPDRSGA
jgi:sarcosine oxidase, subunit alpha